MIARKRSAAAGKGAVSAAALTLSVLLLCAGCAAPDQREAEYDGFLYRDCLAPEERAAYDAFGRAAEEAAAGTQDEYCTLETETGAGTAVSVSAAQNAYQAFLYDNPQITWLDRSFRYRRAGEDDSGETVDAVGLVPVIPGGQERSDREEKMRAAAREALKEVRPGMTEMEKARALFDYLAVRTAYKEEAVYDPAFTDEHTAYGALVGRSAVCDGMALAYVYLLRQCGIECAAVPGTAGPQRHVWTVFKADGTWYEADPTWAALGTEGYFGLTDGQMSGDHQRDPGGIGTLAPAGGSGES
ncbi:MAG: hypothetical protein IJG52_01140 [Lachnospiraceae bacterium]|nr:hypothetical protein [Lachnospiraceae bacterium]